MVADLRGHDGGGLVDVEFWGSAGVSCVDYGMSGGGAVIHFLSHAADGGVAGVGLSLTVEAVGVEGHLLVRQEAAGGR